MKAEIILHIQPSSTLTSHEICAFHDKAESQGKTGDALLTELIRAELATPAAKPARRVLKPAPGRAA